MSLSFIEPNVVLDVFVTNVIEADEFVPNIFRVTYGVAQKIDGERTNVLMARHVMTREALASMVEAMTKALASVPRAGKEPERHGRFN